MIDVHTHLQHMENPQEIIREAKLRGVAALVLSGVEPKDLGDIMEIRKGNEDFVYLTAGFHPHHAEDYSEEEVNAYIEQLWAMKYDIVGIGEVGLEYKQYEGEVIDPELQKKFFRKFVQASIEIGKPLVIHCREAWADTLKILHEMDAKHVLFHCYSGSEGDTKFILQHPEWLISFATNASYTKKHPRLIQLVPLNRMTLETDGPWLDPERPPGTEQLLTNRPWKIMHTAKLVAEIKGVDVGEVLRQTTNNAKKFFGI